MRILFTVTIISLYSFALFSQTSEDSLESFQAVCIDGIDNDGDGLIDCLDPDCLENNVIACLPCFGNIYSYADSVELYLDTCSTENNLFTEPGKILGVPDFDGFYEGGNVLSLGSEGIVQLAFTDNLLGNSGDIIPEIGIFEVGASREGVHIYLRPYDAYTRLMMQYSRAVGPDTLGFFYFGSTDGGTDFFDIDSLFIRIFENNRLLFDGIRLQDIRDFSCLGTSPGADIDAVCASGRRRENCLNIQDDDDDGHTDQSDIDCSCARSDTILIQQQGNICDGSLVLSIPDIPDAEYQWYHDGLAVAGADQPAFNPGTINGNIDLEITLDSRCILAKQIALDVPQFKTYTEKVICPGDSLEYNGEVLNSEGIYSFNLLNEDSCDSIVELNLTIFKDTLTVINRQICEGDSIFFFGETLRMAGEYTELLQSKIGCDSLIYLKLELEQLLTDTIVTNLCRGDSIF